MSTDIAEKECAVLATRIMVFLVAIVVSACSFQKPWSVEEVTGHLPDLDFFLFPDVGQGGTNTAKTYEGKILLMYFGFLQTAGGVPVTMARLKKIRLVAHPYFYALMR